MKKIFGKRKINKNTVKERNYKKKKKKTKRKRKRKGECGRYSNRK